MSDKNVATVHRMLPYRETEPAPFEPDRYKLPRQISEHLHQITMLLHEADQLTLPAKLWLCDGHIVVSRLTDKLIEEVDAELEKRRKS